MKNLVFVIPEKWSYGFKATPHKVHKLEIKHD